MVLKDSVLALVLFPIWAFTTASPNSVLQMAESARPMVREAAPPSQTEAEMRALLQSQVDAWNTGDLDRFLEAYWDSPELTLFSNGKMFQGRAEIAALIRDRYKGGMGQLMFGEPHFEVVGSDVAVARGEWQVHLSSGQERRGLGTAVFRKLNGRWRIVHDHSSFAITAPPSQKQP